VKRFAAGVVALQAVLVIGGWLYRVAVYPRIPVHPGDPYGLGDLIDLVFFLVLVATSAFALVAALVCAAVPRWRNWRAVGVLAVAGLVSAPLFRVVHGWLP
jgi:hypothetical protein